MSSGVSVSSSVVENVVIRNFYYIKKGSFVKQPDLSYRTWLLSSFGDTVKCKTYIKRSLDLIHTLLQPDHASNKNYLPRTLFTLVPIS
ncbi:MAG: hypothetical protein AEth_01256 [Candidatus Argoarchaeum ethanivorans]|uniref:Uncharacterized protein n=1 Tax=Candidatus Argoarchaeum ethanivorans TaxID=2608793 RepID=A0A8B3S0K1_9EURY|nr:MAG: hypothetical protein AEth_01256 [Candidatus Argoarchaeum ethanivorans]